MEQRINKGTHEKVFVPAPISRKLNGDGQDWAERLKYPWIEVLSWGRDGYKMGC